VAGVPPGDGRILVAPPNEEEKKEEPGPGQL